MKAPVILAAALAASAPVRAEFLSGNMLLSLMGGNETARNQAIGYVVGVHDAMRGSVHCGPEGLSSIALQEQVKAMLEQVGELRKLSADVLIGSMLKLEFPCAADAAGAAPAEAPDDGML